ncbi:DNA polymerase III subunit chi [Frigidibacter albus]|uniref:DNA polymerase III subunit chi n=1 Tax=Frigidibacter albus TaxID=1465486 RepID=A0A6L8VCW2_9RHOB|nr:DNA polymerase III subunit chi [Frigidibacter albus]MZQ88147.1 DNA polymerase III subunit chi [Frigidibacter albus]NBE30179.1 DNA polymerase III subunit chi [Frigidibacter albus]GGH47200.1 DNA polymerase III subunit chi [Frigidibacter albus]
MPALFYQLTRSTLEQTAETILGRALKQGWRVTLRGSDAGVLSRLDAALWAGDEAGFLPHGLAGGPHNAEQPVLLTTAGGLPNDPQALMAIGGAAVTAEEVAALQRVWILFDGLDGAALAAARVQWRELTGAGSSAQYWSEEGGGWEKKAER